MQLKIEYVCKFILRALGCFCIIIICTKVKAQSFTQQDLKKEMEAISNLLIELKGGRKDSVNLEMKRNKLRQSIKLCSDTLKRLIERFSNAKSSQQPESKRDQVLELNQTTTLVQLLDEQLNLLNLQSQLQQKKAKTGNIDSSKRVAEQLRYANERLNAKYDSVKNEAERWESRVKNVKSVKKENERLEGLMLKSYNDSVKALKNEETINSEQLNKLDRQRKILGDLGIESSKFQDIEPYRRFVKSVANANIVLLKPFDQKFINAAKAEITDLVKLKDFSSAQKEKINEIIEKLKGYCEVTDRVKKAVTKNVNDYVSDILKKKAADQLESLAKDPVVSQYFFLKDQLEGLVQRYRSKGSFGTNQIPEVPCHNP